MNLDLVQLGHVQHDTEKALVVPTAIPSAVDPGAHPALGTPSDKTGCGNGGCISRRDDERKGYLIHDFAAYNFSRSQAAERQRGGVA